MNVVLGICLNLDTYCDKKLVAFVDLESSENSMIEVINVYSIEVIRQLKLFYLLSFQFERHIWVLAVIHLKIELISFAKLRVKDILKLATFKTDFRDLLLFLLDICWLTCLIWFFILAPHFWPPGFLFLYSNRWCI